MSDICIGIEMSPASDPESFERKLNRIIDDGFNASEISLDGVPVIVSGDLKYQWIDFLKPYLDASPLVFSAHIGRGVDLRNRSDYELHERAMLASIEACSLLGLNPLVIHYEKRSGDEDTERQFREGHIKAAEYAANHGVTLCIENIEVELVAPVVDFVGQIAHPNLKMTFDTGHAWLASRYFKFDYLEAVRSAAPYLGHIHLSDNTGIFEELRLTNRPLYDQLPSGYRRTFGRGDIHLPPFWGNVPFNDIFANIGDYSGIYMCEYNADLYRPFNKEIQQNVRAAVGD